MRFFVCLLSCLLLGSAYAQTGPTDRGLQTASYYLAPVEASGVSGNLQVTEQVGGGSTFIVTLQSIEPGRRYALTLLEGDCGPDRVRVRGLKPVGSFPDDPYTSLTETNLDFADVAEGNYFLYVYAGPTDDTPVAACGEVGVGANATTSAPTKPSSAVTPTPATPNTAPTTVAPATTEATPNILPGPAADSPERSPRAASYALSPVAGSPVSGNLQVSEQLGGGTRLTVSLVGIGAGGNYAVVLYRGDCGPDREEVARLENVNAADGNPNASVTESPLSYDAITGANHFLHVLGEPGGRVLACGEVGSGANP